MTHASGRATRPSARFRRFLRRTLHPAVARLEMLKAAIFFSLHPAARSTHLPHFLGIGGQKSGTTWLDRMLRYHPRIGLPHRKELHFFDGNYWRGLDWYRLQFKGLDNRVRGEITPAYSILPVECIREIRSINPDLRLILILRHPVERAWSHVEMGMIRNRRRRLSEVPEALLRKQIESAGVLDRSRYSAMLRSWLAVFPEEQLLIEFFESIEKEPQAMLARVLRHIGVDPELMPWEAMPLREKVNANAGRHIPEPYHSRLRELLADELAAIQRELPRPEVLNWKL